MGKKNNLKQFLGLVTKIVMPFFLVWVVVIGIYQFGFNKNDSPGETGENIPPVDTSLNTPTDSQKDETPAEPVKDDKDRYITATLLGLDKSEALTDVMLVGIYDTKENNITMFSIPRDSYVELNQKTANKIGAPKVLKLNSIHSYAKMAGVDEPETYTLQAISEITGLTLDHYAKISLSVFNDLVDAIGGVKINVPQLMDYRDPYQNLYIYIEPGEQVLNGKQAEGFVRYRADYVNGDIDRIKMQQYFLKAFVDSALEPEIVKQIPQIVSTLYTNIDTDLSLWNVLSYTKYVDDLSSSTLQSYTIPGQGMYVNDVSYFVYETDRVKTYIQDKLAQRSDKTSASARIKVLNGGSVNGLAGKYKTRLNDQGYNVVAVGTFEGSRTNYTRIYVKDDTLGKDLLQYFSNAKVEVKQDLDDGIDIEIVIGGQES